MHHAAYHRFDCAHRPAATVEPQIRLLAFGFAGGSISSLRRVLENLPPCVEVWGIEYPGRGMRWQEPLPDSLDALLTDLTPGLLALTNRPYAAFGYSMGALIAYTLLNRLRADPCGFIALSAKAPRWVAHDPPWDHLPDSELLDHLHQLGGIPEEFRASPDFMSWFLPVMRADLLCWRESGREPFERLSCPVLALRGEDDAIVRTEHVNGWLTEVSGNPEGSALRTLPGGHFPHSHCAPAVAEILADWLSKSLADDHANSLVLA